MTSSFEAFPMVIAESKMFSLPLVTYELPVVELLKDGKGYVNIEPHNIEQAKNTILDILNNREYAKKLSQEARESIQSFLDFDMTTAWSNILKNPCEWHGFHISNDNAKNMILFWNNTVSMYHEGLKKRPLLKQFIKYIINIFLNPFLPLHSKRRENVVKLYRRIKNIIWLSR